MLLDEKQASKKLNVAIQTLRNWRFRRQGPIYSKINGRLIRYREEDLQKYVDSYRINPDDGMQA